MTEVEHVAIGLAVGEILVLAVLLLRRSMTLGRGQVCDSDLAHRMRQERLVSVRERHRSRRLNLVSLLGHSQRLTSLFEDESDTERVLYSPDAEEHLVNLGVSREHVETVVGHPTYTARRSTAVAGQLERDLGSHTPRLRVAEPWPAFGAVYVKQVEWCQAIGSACWRRNRHLLAGPWRAATGKTSQSSSRGGGQQRPSFFEALARNEGDSRARLN